MIVEIALMLNFQTLAMKSYEGYRIFSFPVSNEIQKEALRKLVKSVRKLKKILMILQNFLSQKLIGYTHIGKL